MNTILCIDTASDRFALAADDDGLVRSFESPEGREHSRLLLPAIAELVEVAKVDAVLVVIGPGAYAGIRVGLATADGLALARGIPVFGIGTLEAVARASERREVTAIHPVGRGEMATQAWTDGRPAGGLELRRADELSGAALAGEGGGALGGMEVTPRMRAEAALAARGADIRAGRMEPGAEAFYLREPSITVSRRKVAAG